jgi:transketolase
MSQLNELERRVIDLSYNNKQSHISSCLTAVNIIDKIYSVKKKDEPFILSPGHAAIALYVVIEKYDKLNAQKIYDHHGTHPDYCPDCRLDCSTGSLGHGFNIGLGLAIANRNRNVYILISDGETMEGSVWEGLRIAREQRLENLRITVNCNGYGANRQIDSDWLDYAIQHFYPSLVLKTNMYKYPSYLNGIGGHYHVLTDKEYKELIRL